jgi:hypothetical protein
MAINRKRALGKVLLILGCLWFVLVLFWVPPLYLAFYWLREPFNTFLFRAEYPISLTTAGLGALLWRGATRKLSPVDYFVVFVVVFIPILAIFNGYGWMHLSK